MAEQKKHVEYRACGGAERTFTNETREMLTQSECSLNIKTKVKVLVAQLCLTLQPHGLKPARLLCPWDFLGKNTGVGSHSLL